MKTLYYLILLSFLFFLLLANESTIVAAENPLANSEQVTFHVTSHEGLKEAFVLLLEEPLIETKEPTKSADNDVQALIQPTTQQLKASLQQEKSDRWTISAILPENPQPRSRVVALMVTESGNVIPTEVLPVYKTHKDKRESAICLEDQGRDSQEKFTSLDEDTVRALIQIRSMKEDVLEKNLKQLLTANTITKLNALEEKYSISGATPLSTVTPLDELLKRINSIESRSKSR